MSTTLDTIPSTPLGTPLVTRLSALLNSAGAMTGRWTQEFWIAAIIRIAGILLVVANAVFGVLEKKDQAIKWLGWDRCHMANPVTGNPDDDLPIRPCLPGRVTIVKWRYPFQEHPGDIFDRPNRIFQVIEAAGGQIEWGEQKPRIDKNGHEMWDRQPSLVYAAVEGGELVPDWQVVPNLDWRNGNSGFVLRRIGIADDRCASGGEGERDLKPGEDRESKQVPDLELWLANEMSGFGSS